MTAKQIKDVWNKPMQISTVAGILVAIVTIAFYMYGAFDKVNTALKTDDRLSKHELSQNLQFNKLDDKLDKMADKLDKKMDWQNEQLFMLVKAVSRIENKADAEKKMQASIKELKHNEN